MNETTTTGTGYICEKCNAWVREGLAEYAHKSWSGWMDYLFKLSTKNPDGTVTIPAGSVQRWERQARTAYNDLPESEKKSDLAEADKMIRVFVGEK